MVFAGSVDDGKSTLIGRLLHDAGGVYDDQLRSAHNSDGLQLAFITDGLRAEREQGITIDVAYRYFSTVRRKFIIADTPGHVEFTRNMVTGSSLAQAAVILIDGTLNLPLPQTVRHAEIAKLLGIKHILFAINKMDLLEMRQEAFAGIQQKCAALAGSLAGCAITYLPISALHGDNVVSRGDRLAWFDGPTLLEYLETVEVASEQADAPFRFPVQMVIPAESGRVYVGRIASGLIAVGDEVMALPSRRRVRIAALPSYDGDLARASAPASIAIAFDADCAVQRGDMVVSVHAPPDVACHIRADVVWLSDEPLVAGRRFLLKHTTNEVCATVLVMESETRCVIETNHPIFCDTYDANRGTGSFIMIDLKTSQTLGAGMIREALPDPVQQGQVIWLTGLSSAGKSTLGRALYERLWTRGWCVELLDGDEIRRELWPDLGFSKHDRDENVRRLGYLAAMLARSGVNAIVAAISPYRAARDSARRQTGKFIEVYVNAPLETCEQRDLKGLYRKARAGEIHGVTGVDDPYEPPETPEVECHTGEETVAESLARILHALDL